MSETVKENKQNGFKMLLKQPFLLLTIVLILVALVIFVILPVFNVLRLGFTDTGGGFSAQKAMDIIRNSSYRETFFNSIKLGLIVGVISTLVGFLFAFAITRTEMPGKKFFRAIATLPIISPPFVLSLALIFLFGRLGLITNKLFNITDFDVYGLKSLVVVQAVSFFPVAFLTLTGILESIDDSVEDAARNMGASRWHVFRTVTLPLAVPGIGSAFLLVFIQSLEDFSNPAVIAGGYSTLAVEAYRVITGLYDMQGGAILAIILLLPTLLAFSIQRYWVSRKSYVTVTGKPTQKRRKIHEKHITVPLFIGCVVISLIVIGLYGTVFAGAFVKTWGVNNTFTLEHFKEIFSMGFTPIKNSIILAAVSAPISGILGMAIAYLTVRHKFFGKKFMEFASILTFAVPGTVLGIGYVLTFNQKPLLLTGTATILVAAFVFRNMPVGIEAGTTTLLQIDPAIEEASTISGAGAGTTFRRITLPLLSQAFFSGLVYAFVRAMTAVSSVIFLISPKWNLSTARIFALFESSQYSMAAAYIVIMIVVILIGIAVINLAIKLLFTPRHLRRKYKKKVAKQEIHETVSEGVV